MVGTFGEGKEEPGQVEDGGPRTGGDGKDVRIAFADGGRVRKSDILGETIGERGWGDIARAGEHESMARCDAYSHEDGFLGRLVDYERTGEVLKC